MSQQPPHPGGQAQGDADSAANPSALCTAFQGQTRSENQGNCSFLLSARSSLAGRAALPGAHAIKAKALAGFHQLLLEGRGRDSPAVLQMSSRPTSNHG